MGRILTAKHLSELVPYRRLVYEIDQGYLNADVQDTEGTGSSRLFSLPMGIKCGFLNTFDRQFKSLPVAAQITQFCMQLLPHALRLRESTPGHERLWIIIGDESVVFTGVSFDLQSYIPAPEEIAHLSGFKQFTIDHRPADPKGGRLNPSHFGQIEIWSDLQPDIFALLGRIEAQDVGPDSVFNGSVVLNLRFFDMRGYLAKFLECFGANWSSLFAEDFEQFAPESRGIDPKTAVLRLGS